jgi:hypothetical protein
MKIKKLVTREVEEVAETVCNMCGEKEKGWTNGLSAYVVGYFGSKLVPDTCSWSFDICEKCLGKIVKEFKVPVEEDWETW